MAATFELDVSMALDDLGWHFVNWTHRGFCDATLWGLRELEAGEYADMFVKALSQQELRSNQRSLNHIQRSGRGPR
jgi:hypothetical protein